MTRKLCIFASILLVSCASLNRTPEHVIRGAKLRPVGGFQSLKHNSKELRMGFRNNGERWAIEAWVVNMASLPSSVEEFKENVKRNEIVFLEKETFEVLDYEIKEFKEKGDLATLSRWRAKDKNAEPKYSYLSAFELSCIHPNEKTLGYNVLVSRRTSSSEPDSSFEKLAMEVISSFTFITP